ncbi:hypothetical protein FE257_007503 [Aspergillus nanangensis]|uniref:Zn(2)-C6 fungal-type domain-containing protein n=1 Tax=Aspergillus nanangensis TaxID=2582783 RepID=A0AAD4CMC7_ASPNN|nr:hypothetical protein FE257_007503 [Aspergillus nanangensis]
MVYRGKPSKSCRECRQRDIKCDKKKEGCSQCSRAGLSCSKYPDSTKLIIHDETHPTINKIWRNRAPQCRPPPDPLATILLPTVEERAKRFYVSQYIIEPQVISVFSYMQIFYPPNPETSPLLVAATHSVFMAFFSSSVDSPRALYHARVKYGILGSRRENIPALNHHLRGALELVSLRGDRQFEDDVGLTLFLQLVELVTLDCLANETDVPFQLLALRNIAQKRVDTSSPRWIFTGIMLHLARLQGTIKSGLPPHQGISWAETIDQELEDLSAQVHSHTFQGVGPRSLHLPDYRTMRCQNNIRVARITLAEIVCQQYMSLLGMSLNDNSSLGKLHETRERLLSLCSDTFYAIPTEPVPNTSFYGLSGVQTSTIFFHLYVAMKPNVISNELRAAIRNRLETLRDSQYSGHEKIMAELLNEHEPTQRNIWQVWFKIGKEDYSV